MSERPVECSGCKKPIKMTYKEIVKGQITETSMCADCPVLQLRLHGAKEQKDESQGGALAGLICARCHTSLESIRMGAPMGCNECYRIFEDPIINELIAQNKLPKSMEQVRRNQPLHIGKTPGKPVSSPSSDRLTSLNEALNEALKKENFEEAAWLRDQIKELMEGGNESKS